MAKASARVLCFRCETELTQTSLEAGYCTQCGCPLRKLNIIPLLKAILTLKRHGG